MTNEIVLLDLFSGIGGFSKGFEDAGFDIKTHYFSEINEHAIANYRYNFKNAHYVGSVENVLNYGIERPNVITFGSPCQDFSIAGRREGLSGERSSLILEAITIVAQLQPDFFIWENVKGTFSSNDGKDFWAIVQAFANIGTYRIEWQLLNTLWALPQNRERIYLVGHLATTERSFAPLFPFTKNDFLFNESEGAKRRQPQTQHSTTINTGFGNKADDTFIQTPKYASTLTVGGKSGGLNSDMTVINAEYFGKSQQNKVYNTDGAMGCLSKYSP